ncbi:DUF4446 family protein [Nocardiopsis alba]|uniref:DUF4446 family protein n=1 Tax=Nocardiopsis alba TaxID=53437 RepID=UPI003672216C
MFTTFLAFIGLLIGLGGLALGVYMLLRIRVLQDEYRLLARRALAVNASGTDPRAVRDVAVLHYDALEEMTGARSFSMALLNSHGDGVVVTSINGRTESRTYAKTVTEGESETLLSPEEYRVVRSARLGAGVGAGLPDLGPFEEETAGSEEEASVTLVSVPGAEGETTGEAGTGPDVGLDTEGTTDTEEPAVRTTTRTPEPRSES